MDLRFNIFVGFRFISTTMRPYSSYDIVMRDCSSANHGLSFDEHKGHN